MRTATYKNQSYSKRLHFLTALQASQDHVFMLSWTTTPKATFYLLSTTLEQSSLTIWVFIVMQYNCMFDIYKLEQCYNFKK